MQIETLSKANLTDLTNLVLALWPECAFEEEYQYFQNIIGSDSGVCFLAHENGAHIGFIQLSLRTDYVEGTNTSPVAYVEGLYVQPAYRHQGIARKLLEAGKRWALQNGCQELASDAELTNEASIKFHKQAGFAEANRIVCFTMRL